MSTLASAAVSAPRPSSHRPAAAGTATGSGLEGIVVAETRLSDVDGERGRLVICGHDVEVLARHCGFEALCALLWQGELPTPAALAGLRAMLGEARQRAWQRLPHLGDALDAADAMDALRAALAHLRPPASASRPDAGAAGTAPMAIELKCEITAAVAVFAAAWARKRRGEAPLPPEPTLGHAADFLRMAGSAATRAAAAGPATSLARPPGGGEGEIPGCADLATSHNGSHAGSHATSHAGTHAAARAAALDAYLVTAADHGMNASTFTARVVASTQSDAVSAIVAALGALKGPLHGGAPGPVLAMLDAIGEPAHAPAWIAQRLAGGERIMGMGHRIYRVRDPRAAVLEQAVERLCAAGVRSDRLALARAVEAVAVASLREHRPERRMAANVEFYTAVILDAVGLPQELFTATFAVARVAGWLAHVDEQRALGRLIRPASRYVGPMPAPLAR